MMGDGVLCIKICVVFSNNFLTFFRVKDSLSFLIFSRGLRDSMGHCVRPSVRPSVFSHFGGDSCITAPAQLIATAFVVFFVRPSVRRSVRPSVRNPLLCERFLHLRSCPIGRD